MKVNKEVNCPNTFIYNEIINSVLYDIKRNTGQKPKRDYLENFTYSKTFNDGSLGHITITKQEANRLYEFQTSTKNNVYYTRYEIQAIDPYHCEISLSEKVESKGFLQKLNDWLMIFLFTRTKKQQFLQMLEAMEKKYQNQKIKEDNDQLKK